MPRGRRVGVRLQVGKAVKARGNMVVPKFWQPSWSNGVELNMWHRWTPFSGLAHLRCPSFMYLSKAAVSVFALVCDTLMSLIQYRKPWFNQPSSQVVIFKLLIRPCLLVEDSGRFPAQMRFRVHPSYLCSHHGASRGELWSGSSCLWFGSFYSNSHWCLIPIVKL